MSWPDLAEFKNLVNLDPAGTDFDATAQKQLKAGIGFVKDQVGAWDDDVDSPDDNLAAAALRAAFLFSLRESPASIAADHIFMSLMAGRRKRFSIA